MEVDELPPIDPNVDYREIFPIHQKRTIAFINHFIMNTVSFLNEFAKSCESRLMEFEYKIQKVEASLLILESQLSSIADLSSNETQSASLDNNDDKLEPTLDLPVMVDSISNPVEDSTREENQSSTINTSGPKASDDPRYKKFFKMIQFGVPPQAVKLKMLSEGVDASILETPNEVIPGYETFLSNTDNSSVNSDNS